ARLAGAQVETERNQVVPDREVLEAGAGDAAPLKLVDERDSPVRLRVGLMPQCRAAAQRVQRVDRFDRLPGASLEIQRHVRTEEVRLGVFEPYAPIQRRPLRLDPRVSGITEEIQM